MTRDLIIATSRALTVADLSAAMAAVHQGRPWTVSDIGDRWRISHCDQLLMEAAPSVPMPDGAGWQTRFEVAPEQDLGLGTEIVRAAAWQAGGDVTVGS